MGALHGEWRINLHISPTVMYLLHYFCNDLYFKDFKHQKSPSSVRWLVKKWGSRCG
jgi:hypothetical protein